MSPDSNEATEAADWAAWLDRFEREIWPVFEARGYEKGTAAVIYFTRLPEGAETVDDDEDEFA